MKFATVVFDFDSTLVDVETLESVSEIALQGRKDFAAVTAQIRTITERGLQGTMAFDESLARRMALIAPRREDVQRVAGGLVEHITPSVLQHRDFFAHNAECVFIVSGGFDELIFPVSDTLGILRKNVFANAFVYDERGVAVGVDTTRPLSQHLGKVKALRAENLKRPLAMVGDGYTDYEVKAHGEADVFIAYVEHTHRDAVVEHADNVALSFSDVRRYLEMML
ncbi:MAG: D-3-phosphoglycerate dehydrogenase [Parcubacteria group bacterium Gr01-1014_8]|nr:MAG: D-3-phosphoglycerate dehydrogenase [Parcubacteria group bacterium Gr01-1014_8]